MCYHTAHPGKGELKKQFHSKEVVYDQQEIFHTSGFGRPFLPVTLGVEPGLIVEARWKLIPYWVKDEEQAKRYANTLNAEGESVFEKASYKPYIAHQRGLLYVTGFYEPHKVAGQKQTENYFIYLPHREIFTLGIVWAMFNSYPTFSILTTPANPQVALIHNEKKRMPLVIDPADRRAWLSLNSDPAEVRSLIKPWEGSFEAHRVTRVTGMRAGEDTNHPDIQRPQ